MEQEKLFSDIMNLIRETFPSMNNLTIEKPLLGQSEYSMDSLNTLKLIFILEKHFGFRFTPQELIPSNFKNIHTIGLLVSKKLSQSDL